MKKPTIFAKLTTILTGTAFLMTLLPQPLFACNYTKQINPPTESKCDCPTGCGQYLHSPFGSYDHCTSYADPTISGLDSCNLNPGLKITFYEMAPCNETAIGTHMIICLTAIAGYSIAGATCEAAFEAACVDPVTGIFLWSTGGCVALWAKCVLLAGPLAVCAHCELYSCSEDDTQETDIYGYVNEASGNSCPVLSMTSTHRG